MESKYSIIKRESSSFVSLTDRKAAEETDPLSSDYPTWSSRIICLQAYACLLMNFSTILRFCYSLGEFGSAILIPYMIFRLFFGISIILIEIMLGRYIMGNVAKIWTMCPFANGMLICLIIITSTAIVFNYVQLIYLLLYISSLFQGNLAWSFCDPSWAKINCYSQGNNNTAFSDCLNNNSEKYCSSLTWETSAKQYWDYVLNETNDVQLLFISLIFVTLSIALVFIINYKGIRSLEKALPILVFLPLILASILAFATYLTPGTPDGFLDIWVFNYTYLTNPKLWIIGFDDTVQALGIGMLALPFVSSHGKFNDDIYIDTLIVVFADVFCVLVSATPLLSVLAAIKSSDEYHGKLLINDTIDVFIWITEAFTLFIYPKVLWTLVFFLEMVILVVGTQAILTLAICETFMGAFNDPFSFLWMSCLMSLMSFLFATPFILIPCFDFYPLSTSLITILFLCAITIQIFYGTRRFNDDFHFMMGDPPSILLSFTWINSIWVTLTFSDKIVGLSSTTQLTFVILKLIYLIPSKPFEQVVYIYTGIPIMIYVIAAIRKFYDAQQNRKIMEAFTANPNWGPSNPILKESRIVFNSQAVTKEFMYRQELYKKPFIKPHNISDQNIVQII